MELFRNVAHEQNADAIVVTQDHQALDLRFGLTGLGTHSTVSGGADSNRHRRLSRIDIAPGSKGYQDIIPFCSMELGRESSLVRKLVNGERGFNEYVM